MEDVCGSTQREKKMGGVIKGCCQIHTHIVHSGFIYYTSANWSQSIFLNLSHYHSLPTLSFSFPHGFSPCFLFFSLIPHCSPPFFLFIQATGSLLIICDLLKYIHCFSLWFCLLFFLSLALSPLRGFSSLLNSLSFLFTISLALSQSVISYSTSFSYHLRLIL